MRSFPLTRKIAIATPIGAETGGPEALHQLCDSLNRLGKSAYLYPWDGTEGNKPVENYKKYIAPIDTSLAKDSILIVPETVPEMIFRAKESLIWWLSVDNSPIFQNSKTLNGINHIDSKSSPENQDFWHRFNSKEVRHLAQSYYAKNYVSSILNRKVFMLTDYIHKQDIKSATRCRKDTVSISLKGEQYFESYRQALSNYEVVQLKGLSKQKVMETLAKSRLYLDLGHQPGRDRLPREAALLNSHVMINALGAGRYFKDAPLSQNFKFDAENKEISIAKIERCLEKASAPNPSQAIYRKWVQSQFAVFQFEVLKLVKSL